MSSQPSALQPLSALGVITPAPADGQVARRVQGFRKASVAARLIGRVGWIALRRYGDPIRAVSAIRRLRAVARAQQWITPTRRRTGLRAQQKYVYAAGRYFWDLYAPGWPSPAFDRYIERELQRVDAPGRPTALNTAILAITNRCSLECEHCFEWDALNRQETLSAADLHEIVRRLRARGVSQLFFSGGEPLQRFADLLSLVQSAGGQTDVWILTSGVGLTPERARRLRAGGATGLALSLDHWDPAAHDEFRGRSGSFKAVEVGAAHARAAGLLVALSLCPTRDFVTSDNLARYAATACAMGASFIQILEPRAVGHYAGADVALRPTQQRLLEQFAARLNTDPAARDLPSVAYPDWSARALGCCGAGDQYVYVDTAGGLHACPFCKAPGVRLLDHDIHDALETLKRAGCPMPSQ